MELRDDSRRSQSHLRQGLQGLHVRIELLLPQVQHPKLPDEQAVVQYLPVSGGSVAPSLQR
jgi:hypothetical protein